MKICDCCRRRAFIAATWSSCHGATRQFCGDCARLLGLDQPLKRRY